MMKRFIVLLLVLVIGCQSRPNPTPTAQPAPTQSPVPETATSAAVEATVEPTSEPTAIVVDVQFSEVVVGIDGNNNYEFIELYNGSDLPFELDGHRLVYLQRDDRDLVELMHWRQPATIPPHGHYLLARAGQDVGIVPDATFDAPLSGNMGGLALRNRDGQALATLAYGEAPPAAFVAGAPASAPANGEAIARLEVSAGYQYEGSHSADFALAANLSPQNSASPQRYSDQQQLNVEVELPAETQPGSEFSILLRVRNDSQADASNVRLVLPLDPSLTPLNLPDYATATAGQIVWELETLNAGTVLTEQLLVQAPYTVLASNLSGVYALADSFPAKYAAPQPLNVAGGAIPIGIARDLIGTTVTVEGVATMYTGGFFAGSTSTKFYMEDATGGIQVFADGGIDDVRVRVGDIVRVTGTITPYRDSIEIIPNDNRADVEIVGEADSDPQPTEITLVQNENESDVLGRLNVVQGEATRIEEFTFSYEVDLIDENGVTTLVYIEKDTGVSAEPLDVGETYRVTGISEYYSARRQIKPRFQSDIAQLFPPEVRVELLSPPSVGLDQAAQVEIVVSNYRPEPLTSVQVAATLPRLAIGGDEATFIEASGNGNVGTDQIVYFGEAGPLETGERASFTYSAEFDAAGVATVSVVVTSNDEPELNIEQTNRIFVGSNVPIWAIQGDGEVSPYVRRELKTGGLVTGIFPDLGGFFIQEVIDDNPATSDGLFVLAAEGFETELAVGDYVLARGRVRELAQQTTLDITAGELEVTDGTASASAIPQSVALDPPLDPVAARGYFEALEGMLVAIDEPAIAIAPTSRFGETIFVLQKHGVQSLARGEASGYLIGVDDGSTASFETSDDQSFVFAKGDVVLSVAGPLAYTFGSYKIEPLDVKMSETDAVVERPLPAIELADGQYAIATYNVENFFDRFDPHPSSPPKPGRAAVAAKLDKIAASIIAMDAPIVIGLQEVENVTLLDDLVALDTLVPLGYSAHLLEGNDSRGIDVAFLVRDQFVTVNSVVQHPMPDGSLSRHPLALNAVIDGRDVTIINAHLTSLSGGEAATEPIRRAQAAWLADVARQAQGAGREVIVLGDLNSFWGTSPLDELESADLTHVYEFVPRNEPLPYTYIFEGRTQTLDHILLSDGLYDALVNVVALHINADYPLPAEGDVTARRTSDHDPLIAIFE